MFKRLPQHILRFSFMGSGFVSPSLCFRFVWCKEQLLWLPKGISIYNPDFRRLPRSQSMRIAQPPWGDLLRRGVDIAFGPRRANAGLVAA